MRNKLLGKKVFVVDGSGLDSGRRGVVIDSRTFSQEQIKKFDWGRYHPFEHNKESIVKDGQGKLFTMFNNRLKVLEV